MTTIGGQAVIEGVMIKAPARTVVACRLPSGKVVAKTYRTTSLLRHRALRLPFIRGVVGVGELLALGIRALSWSADQQTGRQERLSAWQLTLTFGISFALGIALFIVAPYYLALLFAAKNTVLFNAIDGVFRLVIFLGYVVAIGWMPDVRRLYRYHGAEHMAVHCYEAGKKLVPRNVLKYSTCHPRCGTSLIVFVIAVSIIVFSFVRFDAWYGNLLARVILIPLIAGISYELLKGTARFSDSRWWSWTTLPGIWVQKITTQRPDTKMVEVAITAVKKATA